MNRVNHCNKKELARFIGIRYPFKGMILIFVKSGKAEVTVNLIPYSLSSCDFLMLSDDNILIWTSVSLDFEAEIIRVPIQMFLDVAYRIPTTAYWDLVAVNPVFHLSGEQAHYLEMWVRTWDYIEAKEDFKYREMELSSHFLTLFLVVEDYILTMPEGQVKRLETGPRKILNDFYNFIAQHTRENLSVAKYADMLNISPSYLNKLCLRNRLLSPKAIIENQTLVEIKTLLSTTRKPIKQIADEVNFKDDAYLCRFFKQRTGMTPMNYREQNSCFSTQSNN